MNTVRIDQLRGQPTETEWLEFKRNRYEPEQLGEYLSALANSACLAKRPAGYLIFGIDDETHEVVGTNFDPYNTKAKGNQDLLPWLAAGLHPNTGFELRIVDYPTGRVVVFEVGPARDLNVGDFLPGDVATVIRQDAPQALYRNPFLARAMVELNLIDTQGGGIKRMFDTQRKRSFPLPDYDLTETETSRVAVSLHGRILDERYTRLLMERTDLDLDRAMLLDRVQKGLPISREEHRRLKADGLVEGRYPNLMVAGLVAKATGEAGRHIRERGFDKQYYLDLIVALVREHGPVSRKEIDQALIPKLPDRLTDMQKRWKVQNLMQALRRSGQIVNRGTRTQSAWILAKAQPEEIFDK